MGNSKSRVQSVERAIAILKLFSLESPERGVSEIGRRLGLHKSTVSRLVRTLADGGLLSRNPETGRFRLGAELLALAALVTLPTNVRDMARPILRDLAYEIQETVSLSVVEGTGIVHIEQFEPPNYQVKNIGLLGRRMDMHATASGKVFLAHMSREQVEHHLRLPLEQYTPNTMIDPAELLTALQSVRERGYAVAAEEWEAGLNVISAPIFCGTRQPVAAASISGPAYRVTRALFSALAQHLKRATAEISKRLGCELVTL